jgi:hypothetical protein
VDRQSPPAGYNGKELTMARLPYPERDQLAEKHRPLLDEIHARFGRLNHIFRILAHHPILLRRVIDVGVALRHEMRSVY